MTITWMTFAIRLLVGFFLAVGIGIERQWLKTRAVLKTNVLVTLGSAMFVMLSIMTPGDASPTRISAQIVSGVGFLGGGVILREGASVRGINTAATLWCAAAIGTLVGSGFLVQAYVSTLAVVGANLLLRPLVEAFKQQKEDGGNRLTEENAEEMEHSGGPLSLSKVNSVSLMKYSDRYSCHLVCFPEAEVKVLKVVMEFARKRRFTIVGIESRNIDLEGELETVELKVNFALQEFQAGFSDPEEIIGIIKTKAKVISVSWRAQ